MKRPAVIVRAPSPPSLTTPTQKRAARRQWEHTKRVFEIALVIDRHFRDSGLAGDAVRCADEIVATLDRGRRRAPAKPDRER